MSFFDYTVTAQDGSEISLTQFEDKVLLIVNAATGCGFTPQYEDLERIYAAYRDQGFEILDFPCNQYSIISAATLLAALIFIFTGVSLEAWLGVIISLVIIKAGINMLREVLSKIIGERIDPNLTTAIKRTVSSVEGVKGAYDLAQGDNNFIEVHGFYVDEDAKYASSDLVISFDAPDRHAEAAVFPGLLRRHLFRWSRVALSRSQLERCPLSNRRLPKTAGARCCNASRCRRPGSAKWRASPRIPTRPCCRSRYHGCL